MLSNVLTAMIMIGMIFTYGEPATVTTIVHPSTRTKTVITQPLWGDEYTEEFEYNTLTNEWEER